MRHYDLEWSATAQHAAVGGQFMHLKVVVQFALQAPSVP
jgi:hypothetical protein